MYIYQPPRASKAHIVLPVFFIVIFFVAIVAANLSIAIVPALLQLIAVIAAVLAIQIISRYSVCLHTYEINSEEQKFYVRRLTGKKAQLMAELDFSDIVSVEAKDKERSLKEKYNKSYKIHNFCNNIFPQTSYYLVCNVEGQDFAVQIEADKTLLELLETAITTEE